MNLNYKNIIFDDKISCNRANPRSGTVKTYWDVEQTKHNLTNISHKASKQRNTLAIMTSMSSFEEGSRIAIRSDVKYWHGDENMRSVQSHPNCNLTRRWCKFRACRIVPGRSTPSSRSNASNQAVTLTVEFTCYLSCCSPKTRSWHNFKIKGSSGSPSLKWGCNTCAEQAPRSPCTNISLHCWCPSCHENRKICR